MEDTWKAFIDQEMPFTIVCLEAIHWCQVSVIIHWCKVLAEAKWCIENVKYKWNYSQAIAAFTKYIPIDLSFHGKYWNSG